MKLLVVEDNRKVASFLVRALQEEGYVVDRVADGGTALKQARAVAYDGIILDWMLPELDGISVCRALRATGCRTPILMLTARSEVAERVLGLDAGADDYLPKPFDLSELLARVRATLRRAAGAPTRVVVGPLTLDLLERTAHLEGRALDLTAKEHALLSLLARNAGRAVPRTEILSRVWSTHHDPGSNVVEVHVKNLRDKLGVHASLLATVRGIGYRLEWGE